MSLAIRSSMYESIEALAGRVGSYIPREAGMGGSYMSGGAQNVDPARFATPNYHDTRSSYAAQQDEYIPSFPSFEIDETARQEAPPAAENTTAQSEVREEPEEERTENAENSPAPNEVREEAGEERAEDVENENGNGNDNGEFSPEEQRIIDNLAARDREVRAHEQAHVSAGGAYVRGGATYSYESGPDGKRYAVGGEVSIDASPVRDNPEATIAKMQVVRNAAMAPAEPSGQDRAVAAAASRAEGQARAELSEQRAQETQETREDNNTGNNVNDINANQQNIAEDDRARQSRFVNDAVSAYANNNPRTQTPIPTINFAA